MSYNGSGTFLINTAGQPVVSGTVISSTAFNALTADLATGLSTAITKDGQTTVTANIPMGTYKFTGLGAGTAATDSANLSQVQSTVTKLLASVSGADTITAVGSPTLGAYAAGQMFYFVAASANTGAVTINIDSLGAKSITRDGTTALAAGDIQSGEVCVIVYDGTQFQLVNGASQSASIVTENLTVNKATVLNESGGDNDTRIEGDTDANLVFVDASTDRVGVGTNAPLAKFQVGNGTATTEIRIDADGGSGQGGFIRGYKDTSNASWYFGDLNPIAGGTNAGLCAYVYGTDPFVVYTNGSERLRLDSSGNLGLGVTPSAWDAGEKAFQLPTFGTIAFAGQYGRVLANAYINGAVFKYTATGSATQYLQSAGQHQWHTAASGTAGNAITFTQAMTLDASGNLGIGTTSPAYRLDLGSGSGAVGLSQVDQHHRIVTSSHVVGTEYHYGAGTVYGYNYASAAGYNINAVANVPMLFYTNNTERGRFEAAGGFVSKAYVKADTYLWAAGVGNAGGVYLGSAGSSNGLISQASAGTTTTTTYIGNQTITTSSDKRLKANIKPTERNALDLLNQWEIVDHTWNDPSDQCENNRNSRGIWTGVVAQQVQPITPWLVNKPLEDVSEDGTINPWVMDFGYSVPLLVKAIQELKAELDAAKVKIAALETK